MRTVEELKDINVFDSDVYAEGIPDELFAKLRREAPVFWQSTPGRNFVSSIGGYFAVTRHRDVVAISRDPATFSSHRGGTQLMDLSPDDLSTVQLMMLNMDPPQHVKFRNLVRHGFVPRMIALLEPRIRRLVRELIDEVAWRGECDFVKDVAAVLPLQVIAEMLGVPDSDREKVYQWSNQLIGYDDPQFQAESSGDANSNGHEPRSALEATRAAGMQMWMYALQLAEERKSSRGDDLVSVLMRAEVDGERLTQPEFVSFFLLLAVAGNETTRNSIAGGLLALLEHPDQMARLLADPSPGHIALAIEEILRWTTPVIYMARTATRDVELHGQTIREGHKVALYYSSANRDEEIFTDPYRFDVGRTPNDHLGFGTGQHVCIGATLARLELRIMFEELLHRLPDLQLTAKPRRLRSNFINGLTEMHVAFTPDHARLVASR